MDQPPYFPFKDGWRMAMGLKPLPLENWIEIDADFTAQIMLKTRLLTERYADVFSSLPETTTAQQEGLQLLIKHLLHYFPQHYQQQGDYIHNRTTDQVWCLTDFATNPFDLAGRLVQEDLCLMLPTEVGYQLAAASVCFPLRWQLREKLGQPVGAIHQQVPNYANQLERPVDHFFARLKSDYPGYRFNWSIVDSPELFLAQQKGITASDPIITDQNAGSCLWLRVERQTLRRLPVSNSVLFTIRTYIYPLSQIAADSELAHQLANAIEQIPPTMQQYKNLLPIRTALLRYLRPAAI